MAETAYVAFGSNLGDSKKNIETAVDALRNVPGIKVSAVSRLYKTKPWGYEDQSDFLNACARLEVDISAEVLLGACLGIEAGMGRVRKITNGPRIIDIDVLMYGSEVRNTKELKLPHPRIKERDFVMVPLLDVAEEYIKKELKDALDNLSERYIISE